MEQAHCNLGIQLHRSRRGHSQIELKLRQSELFQGWAKINREAFMGQIGQGWWPWLNFPLIIHVACVSISFPIFLLPLSFYLSLIEHHHCQEWHTPPWIPPYLVRLSFPLMPINSRLLPALLLCRSIFIILSPRNTFAYAMEYSNLDSHEVGGAF